MKFGNKKKPTNLKSFVDFSRAKGSIHSKRSTAKKRSVGDFSFGFDKKRKSASNKKSEKFKRVATKAAVILSLSFLFLSLFGILALLGIVSAYSRDLPNIDKFLEESTILGKESVIVDRNGTELYRVRGDVVNDRLTIDEVPDRLQWAMLAIEDSNFRTHKGVDIFGLARSVTCVGGNYLSGNGGFSGCGGGSSITQQLIKITTGEDERSPERKITEAILAMNVEQKYSKDEILEYYLNVLPEGDVLVGMKSGSKYLFGKEDLSTLTLAEMAYLAGIPNQPDVYSPIGGNYDPTLSQERALLVLDRMYEIRDRSGVTKEEIDAAKADVPNIKFTKFAVEKKAPHYVDEVLNSIDEIYAKEAEDSNGKYRRGRDYIKDKGYTIVTAVDLPTQELLENSLKNNVPNPQFQRLTESQNAAGVIMDVKTGEVLALVGSRDFNATSEDQRFAPEHNAATSPRSMGSSVKPILYMTAFTKGYNPLSVVPDLPLDQRPEGSPTPYTPFNYDRRFSAFVDGNRTGRGDFISFRQALRYSLNQPAVSTYQLVGNDAFADMYARLSGDEDVKKQFVGPSAALGAANVSLLDQVQTYSTIAGEGVYRPRKFVLEIRDSNGQVVYDNTRVDGKQVVEKKYTFLITDMNKDYWSLSTKPLINEIRKTTDFAGKTGTSDTDGGPGDIIFIGYTPDVVIGMWSGNSCGAVKCPLKMGANSDYLFDYLYIPFLQEYKNTVGFKTARFAPPEGVRNVGICALTGNAPSPDCTAAGGRVVSDWVTDNSLPPAENMIKKVLVAPCPDKFKLARPIDQDAGVAQEKYYVEYDKIFQRKFLSDQIKKYLESKDQLAPTEECNIERSVNPPQVTISSPKDGVSRKQNQNLNVTAVVTADLPLSKVEVFIDGVIQKTFSPGENYSVSIPLNSVSVGSHKVTVVATDNKSREGRDENSFTVTASGPYVEITSPAQNQTVDGPTSLAVSGSTSVEMPNGTIFVRDASTDAAVATGPVTVSGSSFTGSVALPDPGSSTKTYKISVLIGSTFSDPVTITVN